MEELFRTRENILLNFLQTVGPNLMLPTMLTLWGVVTALQGSNHSLCSIWAKLIPLFLQVLFVPTIASLFAVSSLVFWKVDFIAERIIFAI